MRLIDYLNELTWTQRRLADVAHVSPSTIGRVIQAKTISRENAEAICRALTDALHRPITAKDVDEIHVIRAERPERRGPRKTTETS